MLKEFDLQAAIAGEPVIFRNGEPYKFGAYNPEAEVYAKLVGWDKDGDVVTHSDKGQFNILDDHNTLDLFMAPKQKELWIAVSKEVYDSEGVKHHNTSVAFESKEHVLSNFKNHHIIKITI